MVERPIAIVNDCRSPVSAVHQITFDKLAERFGKCDTGPKDGKGIVPADIEVGLRNGERVKSVSFLMLDVEADADPVKDKNDHPVKDKHGDIIKRVIGLEPPAVDEMLAELSLHGWRCVLNTTYSHGGSILPEGVEHPRYRLTFDTSRPLLPAEVKPMVLHVASLLGIADCFDSSCAEPARLFYLPRCPAERLPLFRHGVTEGEPLDVDALLADAKKIEQAQKSAAASRHGGQSGNVIQAFSAAHDVGLLLEQHGYRRKGRNRWIWPGSTTGMPGVRMLPESERIYSSHNGDPLNDGHAHDAFDCWRILNHGGDMTVAVREAARLLGMEGRKASATASARGEHQSGEDGAPAGEPDGNGWQEPHPLAAKIEPETYPLDALPDTIRAAVEEVVAFVKAPVPMVVSSALAALSLSCQAHLDVSRDAILHGPTGLFILSIADSGERKSQADKMFTAPIFAYQDAQAELAKPVIKEYEAALSAWEAEREGILSSVRAAAKAGKPVDKLRADLIELERDKPERPRVPKLIREDATPEGLAKKLQKEWPSAGVISNEAGIVFGAHGMNRESVMRNLALLNKLWDGGRYQSDRGDDERSRDVRGARLTMGLMIQESTLRAFFDATKGLARGTGFLARFLPAWPDSTMGTRFYTPPAPGNPALAEFHRRITVLLNQPVPIDDDGVLTPPVLPLTPEAKEAWIEFHDAIEKELAGGGEYYDVKDVASKTADNAVRLAALFQVFEHGIGGAVGLDSFESASLIAAWHLHEARRFFGEIALPAELADAARLDRWLIEYCRRERTHIVGKNDVRQCGPLRDGTRLDAAIRELADLDRLRLEKDGKRLTIHLNPGLMGIAP